MFDRKSEDVNAVCFSPITYNIERMVYLAIAGRRLYSDFLEGVSLVLGLPPLLASAFRVCACWSCVLLGD